MTRNWKSWLASASVLLLVGAGCAGYDDQSATPEKSKNDKTEVETTKDSSLDASVDAGLEAAFGEVDASTKEELKENSDAEIITNDSAELNAYGKAYDQNEL
ncbi:MAG: hypothetical protein WC866_04345 [Patescibacteria group bacterium]|jgi:hypothetical protein